MGRYRRIPGIALVNPQGGAFFIHQQVFRPGHKTKRRSRQGRVRLDLAFLARRPDARRDRLGVRRLIAEAPGAINRADQNLQKVNDPAGVETVGMRRNPAHGVHGNRPPGDRLVLASGPVGPFLLDGDFLLKGSLGNFGGNPLDRLGRQPDFIGHAFRAIFLIKETFCDHRHDRHDLIPRR